MSKVKVFETVVDNMEDTINTWVQRTRAQIESISVAAYTKNSSAGPRDAMIEIEIPMAVVVISYNET